jgi:uncharacterized protein DUF6893
MRRLGTLLFTAVITAAVIAVVRSAPDIRRYLKIREM